jgi:hypothetical protein
LCETYTTELHKWLHQADLRICQAILKRIDRRRRASNINGQKKDRESISQVLPDCPATS